VTAQRAKFKELSTAAFQLGDAVVAQYRVTEGATVCNACVRVAWTQQPAI
jgi:hypothetical protein